MGQTLSTLSVKTTPTHIAGDKVFATTELLERILTNLPQRDLIVVQRVSTNFKSTIVGSPHLRRKLQQFTLAPTEGLVPLDEKLPHSDHFCLFGQDVYHNLQNMEVNDGQDGGAFSITTKFIRGQRPTCEMKGKTNSHDFTRNWSDMPLRPFPISFSLSASFYRSCVSAYHEKAFFKEAMWTIRDVFEVLDEIHGRSTKQHGEEGWEWIEYRHPKIEGCWWSEIDLRRLWAQTILSHL